MIPYVVDPAYRAVAKIARRVAHNPTGASVDDARKMARAILKMLKEPVPDEAR